MTMGSGGGASTASALLRTGARSVRRLLRAYPCVPLRRAVADGRVAWVQRLPARLLDHLDLDGTPIRPLRVELGGGPFPTPGYVHVDGDRNARHLEHIAPVWRLPFADAEVDEILAVHVLEHVHPALVPATLQEWRRVLAPHGVAKIHVPDGPAICRAFEQGTTATKWATINALFGYYGGPEVDEPHAISLAVASPDHKLMFDFALLEDVLHRAGFDRVVDRSDVETDRHVEAWADLVPGYSLIVEASSTSGSPTAPAGT